MLWPYDEEGYNEYIRQRIAYCEDRNMGPFVMNDLLRVHLAGVGLVEGAD